MKINDSGRAGDAAVDARLLVIDDTPTIHDDIRKVLAVPTDPDLDDAAMALFGEPLTPRQMRFQIDSAFQSDEGLKCVERACAEGRPYAVAIVDIRMPPGRDGVETIARLWKLDPHIQIVLCSAYSDYSWPAITRQLGQSDQLVILKKPFDGIEMLQLAHALTKRWSRGV